MNAPLHRNALNAYAQISLETGIESANPHQLITMLFDGALLACNKAKAALAAGDIPAKGQAVGHAINIITLGLKAGLNVDAGGDLGKNLADLYDYMGTRLFFANAENDSTKIDEVITLLTDIKGAWDQVPQLLGAQPAVAQGEAPAEAPAASQGETRFHSKA